MKRYSADPVLAGLKDFQRATVDHVMDRYSGPNPTRRFLVADETGLGKSVVARGIVAKLYEKLQDDPEVNRVDVVYVCSNQDIANQNLARLKVATAESVARPSRLTMLAKHAEELRRRSNGMKPLNLIAFTPGTSFDRGWATGKAEERAMVFLLLESARQWNGWTKRAAYRALQGTVSTPERFEVYVGWLRESLGNRIDPGINTDFIRLADAQGLLDKFDDLLDRIGRSWRLPVALQPEARSLTAELRNCLARAGVNALEPDLVILDEFQRFRHLLERNENNEAAELAHHLFEYPQARVLLLSATPYKPFTLTAEAAVGDDHHRDFQRTLRFLSDDESWNASVTSEFAAYREALVTGGSTAKHRDKLRNLLLTVMTRTERPAAAQEKMLAEYVTDANVLTSQDLVGFVAMKHAAKAVNAPATIEYWKSAPYFLNFTEGYKIGSNLKQALGSGPPTDLQAALHAAQLLDTKALHGYREIDPGNSRLRHLMDGTVGRGWWKLLWMPPSMPHYELGEPFRTAASQGITKRLLFSSWTATPTAVAGLLSYEAERRMVADKIAANTPEARRRITGRLDYRLDGERAAAMSTLSLFWPHPTLAGLCDPLHAASRSPEKVLTLSSVDDQHRRLVQKQVPNGFTGRLHFGEAHTWTAYFRFPGSIPAEVREADAASSLAGTGDSDDSSGRGLAKHVRSAFETALGRGTVARGLVQVLDDVVALGTNAPGNVAWRALGRQVKDGGRVTAPGHWRAAGVLAGGLRSLFNRADVALLLDQLYPDGIYWRSVLRYCAAGGLQAVLDEYLHHLTATTTSGPLDDEGLMSIANAAAAAIALRPSTYRAFDPRNPDESIALPSRFALRYGSGNSADGDGPRQHEVREAFNSPFWPFVVATTSAGQEGIDFHWWCSAVVHWNTPANPVDFEQREGRVHRYGGHAIRRNIAARQRAEAFRASEPDVWKSAYEIARNESGALGDFAPYWVYPGDAKIERHVMPYPLSRDGAKLTQLKRDLATYRLAFGQPRQEDLLELLADRGVVSGDAIDLRP